MKNSHKILFLVGLSLIILIFLMPEIFAQNFDRLEIPKPPILPGPENGSNQSVSYFRDVFLTSLSRIFISIVGGLALLFFIIGGVRLLTNYGEESGITGGKNMLKWSIIGFLIAIFSYAIVSIISNIQIT